MDFCFKEDNWIADEVTIDGVMYRRDWPVLSPEGQALVSEVLAKFPDVVLDQNAICSIGRNEAGMRAPYVNDTISWYTYGLMPQEICDKYKVSTAQQTDDGNGRYWYGLKFDMSTGEIMLKLPSIIDIPLPEGIPYSIHTFLGKIYHEGGAMDENVDIYFNAPGFLDMAYFLYKRGLKVPITAETYNANLSQYCWGLLFNKNTMELGKLKLYKFLRYSEMS